MSPSLGCQVYIPVVMFFVCFRVCIKESSVNKLGSVCRRVYRIFSHAYFHHRTLFDEYEVRYIGSGTGYLFFFPQV